MESTTCSDSSSEQQDMRVCLDNFVASVGVTTKRDIVRQGFSFLTGTKLLSEGAAISLLEAKINVRSPKAVKYHLAPSKEPATAPSLRPGRPPVIPGEKFDALRQWITSEYAAARYLTMEDIVNKVLSECSLDDIDVCTLNHNLNYAGFRSIKATPQEPGRICITTSRIDENFKALTGALCGVPARLVINADESGFQPWTDSKDVRVWVPSGHIGDTVQVPVDRQTKRVTILAGITLSGATIRPLVIIPRKSFELELAGLGYSDFAVFAESQKGYASKERFKLWLLHAVAPYLNDVRRDIDQPNSRALLIMDGCSAHNDIDELCASLKMDVLKLPAHSSHLLQPLDLVTFGLQKKRYARVRIDSSSKLNKQTQNVHRILFSLQQACTTSNNVAAFRKGGIILCPSCSDGRIILRGVVDRSYASKAMQYLTSPECLQADQLAGVVKPAQISTSVEPLDDILGAPVQIPDLNSDTEPETTADDQVGLFAQQEKSLHAPSSQEVIPIRANPNYHKRRRPEQSQQQKKTSRSRGEKLTKRVKTTSTHLKSS